MEGYARIFSFSDVYKEVFQLQKPKRPTDITYCVDDKPPFKVVVPLVLQQIITLSVDLMFPVIIIAAIGGPTELAQSFVSLMMITMGIGTIMQSSNKGLIGSGYFCAQETNALFVPVSILAAKTGGLHLLLGMTVVAGAAQALFSRLIHKLRVLFPVEITGLIITMLPISLIRYSFFSFAGDGKGNDVLEAYTAFATLAVIMIMFVWGREWMRQYAIITGCVVGFLIAYSTGLIADERLLKITDAPLVAFPNMSHIGWSFSFELLIPFLLVAFSSSIKTIGNISACQKVNDANWTRLDMKSISGGLLAEGLGTMLSGVMGAMAQCTSSGSVGLSIATGAVSRYIGYCVGAVFIALAFFPKIGAMFAVMPEPVMAAVLMIQIIFVIPAGMQMCTSRMLDVRKTIVLGVAITVGLAVEMFHGFEEALPFYLQTIFKSSLSATAFTAVLLNLLFRIGISKHKVIEMVPGSVTSEEIAYFMESSGSAWGARREIINRAAAVINEFMEAAADLALSQGKVKVDVSFEEFNLDVNIYYQGKLMNFPAVRPTAAELWEDEAAMDNMAGFLIKQHVDWLKADMEDGQCHIQFHFDH